MDGKLMREADYIARNGNIPLKNNLIRRMVNAVLGVYRSQSKEPTCTARDRNEQKYGETMSTVLQCNMQLNRLAEINSRCMEEFLISGLVVQRKWFGWRNDKLDCWTDYVQPNNFFIDNNRRDFRGWDVSCLGEIHDISFDMLCQRFGEAVYWKEGCCGWVPLPDDFMRLVAFRMSDWERTLYGAVTPADAVYALQSSRYKGVRGNPQKPVCAVVQRPVGLVLEFYSCRTDRAHVSVGSYVPYPRIDGTGGIDISAKCYKAVVYQTAALVLGTYGETGQGELMSETAKGLLV